MEQLGWFCLKEKFLNSQSKLSTQQPYCDKIIYINVYLPLFKNMYGPWILGMIRIFETLQVSTLNLRHVSEKYNP